MELLTSYHFEISLRAKFLTLILAAEALLEADEKTENVKLLVDKFKSDTNNAKISKEEKASILGSLRWLYRDSISQSLKKMADNYLYDKTYQGMSSRKFIKTCYEARSKLVHTGSLNGTEFNIGTLTSNLSMYLTHMLTRKAGL